VNTASSEFMPEFHKVKEDKLSISFTRQNYGWHFSTANILPISIRLPSYTVEKKELIPGK
jgi:hypothetical protein